MIIPASPQCFPGGSIVVYHQRAIRSEPRGSIIYHQRAIRSEPYRSKRRAEIAAALSPESSTLLDVLHDNDGWCCREQSWGVTAAKIFGPIIASVAGLDPEAVVAQWAEHEPSVVIAGGAP